jgi:hypothetical protein
MTEVRFVEGQPHHCGQMARALRHEYRDIFAAIGLNAHRELRAEFDRSYFRRTALVDGRVAAMWGVSGTKLSSTGYAWLALSQEATKHRVEIVRRTRRELDDIMQSKVVIQARILPGDETARRFARFLGFRPAGEGMIEYRREWPQVDAPFVVFSLPRSRSRWLATFLSVPGTECSHDLPVSVSTIDEMCEAIKRGGSVETCLTRAWRIIRERIPNVRFAVIRRPIEEVRASAARFGWTFPDGHLEAEEKRLEDISALPGTVTLTFRELAEESAAASLYEHCTGQIMPPGHFETWNARNIQIDMKARYDLLTVHQHQMVTLFKEIEQTVTIQAEPFDTFYRDGQALFQAHVDEVGTNHGHPIDPNVELARAMERQGYFLAMTARRGDKMVGYIVFMTNPAFESRTLLLAFQNIFFVLPEFRGRLGLKLHAAARKALKARGVEIAILRSGMLGRGPAMERFFKRLGARSMGEMYALPLED